MRKTLLLLLVSLSFLATGPAHANREDLPNAKRAADFANRLMIDISRGKTQEAWKKLKANSIIPPDRVDAFAAGYENQLSRTIQSLGQPAGVELVEQAPLGGSLMRITYLVKYRSTGIVWYLYFYRMAAGWMISEINYDLNTNSLFARVGADGNRDLDGFASLAWREQIEKRLDRIEQAGVEGDGRDVDVDRRLEINNELDRLKTAIADYRALPTATVPPEAAAPEGGSPTGSVSLDQMRARLSRLDAALARHERIEERLQALENRVASIAASAKASSRPESAGEETALWRAIETLSEMHPYLELEIPQ